MNLAVGITLAAWVSDIYRHLVADKCAFIVRSGFPTKVNCMKSLGWSHDNRPGTDDAEAVPQIVKLLFVESRNDGQSFDRDTEM